MKITYKNWQPIKIPLDISCLEICKDCTNFVFTIFNYKNQDLHILLEDLIFEIARDCDISFPDPNITDFKFYIPLNKAMCCPEMGIEIFPVKIKEEDVDERFITKEQFEDSKSFYENPLFYDNSAFISVKLSKTEKINFEGFRLSHRHR